MKSKFIFWGRLFISLSSISFIVWCVIAINPYYGIAFNMSESLKGKFFIIDKKKIPRKGNIIAFYPPHPNMTQSRMPFLKIVKGSVDDLVEIRGRNVYLNGSDLGVVKEKTKKGLKLKMIKPGIIPKNKYFVWSSHKDSYDSRYEDIGLVDQSKVIGVAHVIF